MSALHAVNHAERALFALRRSGALEALQIQETRAASPPEESKNSFTTDSLVSSCTQHLSRCTDDVRRKQQEIHQVAAQWCNKHKCANRSLLVERLLPVVTAPSAARVKWPWRIVWLCHGQRRVSGSRSACKDHDRGCQG